MPEQVAPSRARFIPIVAAATVVVGVALRVRVLTSGIGRVDADEAVVGLMARDMLHGHLPAFFWGQAYGGSLEPALVAAVFRVTGTSTFGVKSVPLLLAALATALVYLVARRLYDRDRALLAAALFTVYPAAFIWWSTKERGFYWVSLVCALAGLLLGLRLAASATPRRVDVAGFGLVAGVGWWTSPQTMFVLGPVVVVVLVERRREWRRLLVGVPFVLLGALPWLFWNVRHDFDSLHQPPAAVASTYTDRLHLFFARLLPTALGLRRPFTGSWLFRPAAGVSLYVVALVGFAVLAWRATTGRAPNLRPLVLIALVFPLLFAIPSTSYYVAEPRYALVLSPVVVLLITSALRTRVVQTGAVAIAVVLAIATVGFTMRVGDDNPYAGDLAPARLDGLRRVLADEGVDRAYADYWIAYPLTFATDERVVVSPADSVRDQRLAATVASAPRSTYIVFRGQARDRALRSELVARHVPFRHRAVDRFSVYLLSRPVAPPTLAHVWAHPSP
jgi:4-amino-4-deoxy-L-arabinose transferase-like glycosyltransferase